MSQIGMAYNPYHNNRNFRPTERFYVRSSVYLPGGDVDPVTGSLLKNSPRHGRTQAMRMEARQLDLEYDKMNETLLKRQNQKGIHITLRNGVLLVCAFVLLFAVILLTQQGTLAQQIKTVAAMTERIETIRAENDDLQAQIDEASDASTICYTAAQDLDMVPSNATQAIHLTAVDTRPTESSARVAASADSQSTDDTVENAGN